MSRVVGRRREQAHERHAALAIVDTEVNHIRHRENRVIAGWMTIVGTEDGRGFQVAGCHTFEIRERRINSLKIVVSSRPEVAKNLALESLIFKTSVDLRLLLGR